MAGRWRTSTYMGAFMMKRYCLVIELKPECVKDYVDIHKNVWPELLNAMKEAEAENLLIYIYKNLSIVFYECEDIDKFYEKYGSFEVTKKWNAIMATLLRAAPVLNGTGNVATLEKIMDFKQQLNGKLESF